jgi:hypothetical protein
MTQVKNFTRQVFWVVWLGLFFLIRLLPAQDFIDLKAHYTKAEHTIPMRDGVRLFAAVFTPKDTTQKYPIMMKRTPYSCSPYGTDEYPNSIGPSVDMEEEGYIFVHQDVRGRYMSEGEFIMMTPHKKMKRARSDVDESTDTYDTIDWLLKNIPHHNGRVGMWGIS